MIGDLSLWLVKTLLLVVVLLLCSHAVFADTGVISIDSVAQFGRPVGDYVVEEHPVEYFIRWTNNTGTNVTGATNGYAVWAEANGAVTGSAEFCVDCYNPSVLSVWNPAIDWGSFFDGIVSVNHYLEGSIDTVGISTFKIFNPGLPVDFDDLAHIIIVVPYSAGDTLCIDSSFARPGKVWLWSISSGGIVPEWSGKMCLPVVCCLGSQGNVDLSEGPGLQTDISDLVALVSYMFPPHTPLICSGVGNVDGLTSGVPIDIADITYLVDFLFNGGPPPVTCD